MFPKPNRRVRLPYPAPARRKRHIACDELFHFIAKLIARSFRCSSLPNRNRFAGLRFGAAPCAIFRRLRRLRIYGAKAPPARRPVRGILSNCCRKSKISILTASLGDTWEFQMPGRAALSCRRVAVSGQGRRPPKADASLSYISISLISRGESPGSSEAGPSRPLLRDSKSRFWCSS